MEMALPMRPKMAKAVLMMPSVHSTQGAATSAVKRTFMPTIFKERNRS